MKIGLLGAIKLAELGPKNLIDEAPRRPEARWVGAGRRIEAPPKFSSA
jgi:hypothetical protein